MASVKTAGLNAQVDVLSDNDEAVFTPTGKIQYNCPSGCPAAVADKPLGFFRNKKNQYKIHI